MPELPEVEVVRRGLEELLAGKVVASVEVVKGSDKSFQVISGDVAKDLVGAEIVEFHRRGKALIFKLSSGYYLMNHLKMTGQMVVRTPDGQGDFAAGHPNESFVNDLPDSSTRVIISFKDGTNVFFNDQRRFGWIKLMSQTDVDGDKFLNDLGPEPFEQPTADQVLARAPKGSRRSVKSIALDQGILAGVGNIYADEGLHMSGLHPSTPWNELSDGQIDELVKNFASVMQLSIDLGGSSDRNYVMADGSRGNYLEFAKVFKRDGQPCTTCGTEIVKVREAGRGTHFCPVCQPKSKGYE